MSVNRHVKDQLGLSGLQGKRSNPEKRQEQDGTGFSTETGRSVGVINGRQEPRSVYD